MPLVHLTWREVAALRNPVAATDPREGDLLANIAKRAEDAGDPAPGVYRPGAGVEYRYNAADDTIEWRNTRDNEESWVLSGTDAAFVRALARLMGFTEAT